MKITAKLLSGSRLTLPSPFSLVCNASYDVPADSLEVVFPAASLQSIGELSTIKMELDGKPCFEGIVDEQRLIKNTDGIFLKVQARGNASVLLDNEAIPQTFYRASLLDIYNAVCGQYGFAGIICDKQPRLSAFTISKGQSEWQALESFCRQTLKLRPFVRDNYIVAQPRQAGRRLLISNTAAGGLRFSSIAVRNKRYGVISKVILKNDYTKAYDTAVYNPLYTELKIKRKRYISPPSDWAGDPKQGADRLMRDSMLKKTQVTVTLTGLIFTRPGDTVRLDDSTAGLLKGDLTVFDVCHKASGGGCETTLELVLPAYL